MAHYAKLDENNNVISVEVVANSDCIDSEGIENEETGRAFLENIHGWSLWKKCSYNTKGGKYYNSDNTLATDQTKAFRKNYPATGYTYDANKDAFIPPKPFESHTLNETTCEWESSVPFPSTVDVKDENNTIWPSWNETNLRWEYSDDTNSYYWNETDTDWVQIT